MKILVTGSAGTIGTRLCEKLLAEGKDVVGLDWVPCKWNEKVNAITTIVDLRDEKAVQALNLPKDIDVVVHLAANARVYELVEDPGRARDNFLTLFNTLEMCRTRGIRKFMFASSRECYGNADHKTYTEDLVRVEHCESPYTASKLGGEALVWSYKRCYDIDAVIFRFSNVYGMYDESNRIVPLFIRLARDNKPMTVFGEGKCLDFTYIDDTVAGIMLAIEKFETAKNDSYNLAYGEGTTLVHLAEAVKELTGATSTVTTGPSRRGEVVRYVADISKAKKALGYAPKTSFAEGIKKSVEWYKANT